MLCCAVQVLKEQTRRYKQRLHEAERNTAGLEQQLLAAQSANSKLKSQLQEGDAGQEAEELAQARQQAEGLAKALEVGLG
jgi:septal ring factor EnvC (AmiA/AmiB activator)